MIKYLINFWIIITPEYIFLFFTYFIFKNVFFYKDFRKM